MTRLSLRAMALAAPALAVLPAEAFAHGFAGDRFFPATILTDDPFVADEMSLPTVTTNPPASDGSREIDVGVDLSKRITPNLGITIGDQWERIWSPSKSASTVSGFDALDTGVQYQLFVNGPHEAMALFNFGISWANTGSSSVGAPTFTTLSPGIDFGKGLGDLPESLPWIRPFAVTGNIAVEFPTVAQVNGSPNPNTFDYGFAIEYSLEYLQHHVEDVGLGKPFDHMIPLVEFALTTPINRGGGVTTGTVQPGLIWAGQYYQLGAEMIVPVNGATGHGIGGVFQFHLFLDDIFPRTIGRPLFGY